MSTCKYPNLRAEHKDGWWCIDALAHGAGVSSEIMKEVLLGNDGLTSFELMKLGNYIFSNYDYVCSPRLSVLDKRPRHRMWMKELDEMFYQIWEYAKAGYQVARSYMKGYGRTMYVNMSLAYQDGRTVTYAKYRKVKSDMESVIFDCEPVITRTHKLCEEVLS